MLFTRAVTTAFILTVLSTLLAAEERAGATVAPGAQFSIEIESTRSG
ncbi:hypothetical protein ACFY36_31055 [Actinoplanes sp. NPDC000266]